MFRSSFEGLDKSNRWVSMGDLLPWPELEKEYNSRLNNSVKGAGNKPARLILGAMLIKHKLCLSDIETIELIRENPYMQYMCGLSEFTDKPIFEITKLKAAQIATAAGIPMMILNGRDPRILYHVIDGQRVGTYFSARKEEL